jgi:hypothetical protein
MDTQTVLEIIAMLDAKIIYLQKFSHVARQGVGYEIYALEQFRDHLQEYIENQVAHMETEQGM